ncbi:FAD-dependent monooxygenase [Oceaniglobus roseus]|uniref:FAD-dependent monooxygenase n=1 Tax=Oceaniglobus roseus TaxID=1737570 RepID=UPI000C7F38A4|nr:FAD-dependent monooxygenase [Kandeliimicrobium roseum]
MTRTDTDILVSGGGIAGLVAAAGLAHRGFRVCVVDPVPPVQTEEDPEADLRSTAFLQPARALFERLGLWEALSPEATPLRALRVIDTQGWPPQERIRRQFEPADLGEPTFGWNIANWRSRAVLARHLEGLENVDLRLGVGFAALLTRTAGAVVTLTDGSRVDAKLVVAADGRNSPVREAAGIGAHSRTYGQSAIVFSVAHDLPHDDVSTEIYNAGGAFTTVPLNDHEGRPASAIVWMNDNARSAELAAMSPEACGAEATLRSVGVLGQMRLLTPRRVWPVITRTADRLTARRTVLIAEAAHVLPPIGAQGLNTSLHDVATLLDCLGEDPGAPEGLERHARIRGRDVTVRAGVIDLFNRVCRSDFDAVVRLRSAGLRAVHDIAPIRRGVMRAGLGATD